jgi:hypothetical protein
MSRPWPSTDTMSDVCSTCRGVLRLQARWTRLQETGESRRERIERMAAEAQWFVLTLEKVRPCPSHAGVLRLARHLARELWSTDPFRAVLVECER